MTAFSNVTLSSQLSPNVAGDSIVMKIIHLPAERGDGHTFRSLHPFAHNYKILHISEQQPRLGLLQGSERSATLARVKTGRISKVAGLSFAGFVAASIVADKVNLTLSHLKSLGSRARSLALWLVGDGR